MSVPSRESEQACLKDWTNAYETMPYPPSSGVYAIYTIDDLLDHINYTIVMYCKSVNLLEPIQLV
jgi:hypothetical protein